MKSTPNLPASSRMQMPASSNKPSSSPSKSFVKQGGVASKLVGSAKGKGMKSKSC